MRFYLIHEDNTFDNQSAGRVHTINEINANYNTGNRVYLQGNTNWSEQLREMLAAKLTAATDHYGDNVRELTKLRIWIDLGYEDLAGAGWKSQNCDWLPEEFQKSVFNPKEKRLCFFRCLLGQGLFKTLEQAFTLFGLNINPDYQTYFELAHKFKSLFPDWCLKICDRDLKLKTRAEGEKWKQMENKALKCRNVIYLIHHDNHYCRVTKPRLYIQFVKKNAEADICPMCDKIYEDSKECAKCPCIQSVDFVNTFGRPGDKKMVNMRKKICEMEKRKEKRITNYQCASCKTWVARGKHQEHECFMTANEIPKDVNIKHWYAFDYEAMLIPRDDDSFVHEVNLVCVQKMFDRPFKRWTFLTIAEFLNWIESEIAGGDEPVAFIAHNLKGYDGRLTLNELFGRDVEKPVEGMTWEGLKIQCFQWNGVYFRDSLLHIQQPLATFPKVFGLKEMHKGWFPYRFNTPANQNYVGPFPPLADFEPEMKSPQEKKALCQWYAEQQGKIYDFHEELVKYCQSDVDILAQALEKYYHAGQTLNHPNLPPLDSLTAASYTVNCWKTLHFQNGQLAYHTLSEEKRAREALRGGRTDVRVMYKKWSMEDVMVHGRYGKYADVQSMYPYVMYTQPMPVGKPKVHTQLDEWEYDEKIHNGFGFINVDLLPPLKYVHHPPFAITLNNRLCCSLNGVTDVTLTTVELKDALACGWRVDKINWLQDYQSNSDLFKDYIRKLVREKIHSSSGPPANFDEVARNWKEKFGVELDREKMAFNPGLRAIAKLQLNSLWGKLGERPHLSKQEMGDAETYLTLEDLEAQGELAFKQVIPLGVNSWFFDYEFINPQRVSKDKTIPEYCNFLLIENRQKTNVAVASFVTMWGRRMLWEQMMKLGQRTIYHDTDSIIFEYQPGEYNIPLGKYLGDWEDELPGKPIIEFVSLAPKTYGYRYLDTPIDVPEDASADWYAQYQPYELWEGKLYPVKECVKAKGFKLHSEAMKFINFDGLLDLLQQRQTSLTAPQLTFKYDRGETSQITSQYINKNLIFNYEKGIVGPNFQTYPFGSLQYTPDRAHDQLPLLKEGDSRYQACCRRASPAADLGSDNHKKTRLSVAANV